VAIPIGPLLMFFSMGPPQGLSKRGFPRGRSTIAGKIAEIYFGHSHVSINRTEYKGMQFFNSGSAIRGMKMNMLEFSF